MSETNIATLAVGLGALFLLYGLKRRLPRAPAALVVVVVSIIVVKLGSLESRGVKVVGNVPDSMPQFHLPSFDGSLVANLAGSALVITIVGFMQSVAVAKVYARRHRYEVVANRELVGLGLANIAAGAFGGYPVTGGFSRTAVNNNAGAKTPLASVVAAGVVLATIAFLTPLFSALPNAALGAIIVTAIVGLIDVAEMRRLAAAKRSDLLGLGVAFLATLAIGIERGILLAVIASLLVAFRAQRQQCQPGKTTSRWDILRKPTVERVEGIWVIHPVAAVSFVNAARVKAAVLVAADQLAEQEVTGAGRAIVFDASAISDLDVTGAEMIRELNRECLSRGIELHVSHVAESVQRVLDGVDVWAELEGRVHDSTAEAVSSG